VLANANITALQSSITAANLAIASFVTGSGFANITQLTANITAVNSAISTQSTTFATNVAVAGVRANVTAANSAISSLQANIAAANVAINNIALSPSLIAGVSAAVTSGNLVPTQANVYTLGTPELPWNHLYVGTGSVTIGNITLSDSNGGLAVVNENGFANGQSSISGYSITAQNTTDDFSNSVVMSATWAYPRVSLTKRGEEVTLYVTENNNLGINRGVEVASNLTVGGSLILNGGGIDIDNLTANNITFTGQLINPNGVAVTVPIRTVTNEFPTTWYHAPIDYTNDRILRVVVPELAEPNISNRIRFYNGPRVVGSVVDVIVTNSSNLVATVEPVYGMPPGNRINESAFTLKPGETGQYTFRPYGMSDSEIIVTGVNNSNNFTMSNHQQWTSNVSTIGDALNQLAARLKAAGF
jgi:hypothetical protein